MIAVSIHASSREDATCSCKEYCWSSCSFNPRVLAGGRDILTLPRIVNLLVSIHASSREDATICRESEPLSESFNPRVLAGGRDLGGEGWDTVPEVSIHASSREDATMRQGVD